jgi:hypothetical protein
MAGTMPHAVFVETDLPFGGVAGYAAELPGCATFAATDTDAVAAIPQRVVEFTEWLRSAGEEAPRFEGGNWYEVERATAADGRAVFSLDALPPSDDEFERWLRWLELARAELATAVDGADPTAVAGPLREIASQDLSLVSALGGAPIEPPSDPVDALYAARDALTDALIAAGAGSEQARRVFRLAIADDLRVAAALGAAGAA